MTTTTDLTLLRRACGAVQVGRMVKRRLHHPLSDECRMTTIEMLTVAMKWVEASPKRSMRLDYGYGLCEVPWLELLDEGVSVFSGDSLVWVEFIKGETT